MRHFIALWMFYNSLAPHLQVKMRMIIKLMTLTIFNMLFLVFSGIEPFLFLIA